MATQRYISTSFWDDEWIRSLDPSEKFVYLYLMTNTLTNIAGVYKISIARICFDTGYNDDTIKKILKRFQDNKKAYLYNGYMILPTWPKHQKWQNRTKIKDGIETLLKELDSNMLGFLKAVNYRYPIDTLCIPYDKVSIPYVYVSNYSDTDINTDIDIDLYSKPPADAEASIVPLEVTAKESALYLQIKTMFEQEQPKHRFTDYGKEGKAIKGLIKKCENYSPDDTDWIFAMIALFKELRQSDNFYGKQPFTPSALNSAGIFDRVLNEARNRWESNQVSEGEIIF